MSSLHESQTLESAARMFDAAMPSTPDAELNAMVARSVRSEQVERLHAESLLVGEACRLTEEWMNGYFLGRGTEPGPQEVAAVAIGYYN